MFRVVTTGMLVAILAGAEPAAAQVRLVVSAATSLRDAVEEIGALYTASTGVAVDVNAAGSNTLARQIVEGARVAVFLSADAAQMDVVERAGLVAKGTRAVLVTNDLVLVAPADAPAAVTATGVLAGNVTRLAMGEPSSVPAGVYGRRWLEREGAWAALAAKVVPLPSARAVLAAVEAGRAGAGIVYATDARDARVRVLTRVSGRGDLHIVCPAAVVAGPAETEGRRFLAFLESPAARAVFTRRGFGAP